MDLLARAPATGDKFDSPIGHGCLDEVVIGHLTQPIFRELPGGFQLRFCNFARVKGGARPSVAEKSAVDL